jgi:NRPS condensation-like uncharacterized protein
MTKKTLLDTIKPATTVEDLDKIAEQIHSTGKQNKAPKEEDEDQQHRLTIDLPKWLVKTIKAEGKKNGQTVRGVILASLLEKFKK